MKRVAVSIYSPPNDSNMKIFFEKVVLKKYENCIIMGDFNVDTNKPDSQAFAQLKDFCYIFDLANTIYEKTCFTKNHSSEIGLVLSNKPSSSQLSHAT